MQKMSLVESSLEVMKERIKGFDIFKSNIESRVNSLQNKLAVMSNLSSKIQKQNFSSFDAQLSNSQVFTTNLKKLDANSLSNLKRLQDRFRQEIVLNQSKFVQVEQKLIGMFLQKEKILRNINFQIQNHGYSINAIEEWIKADHQKSNSISILQDNLRQKMEAIQKTNELRQEIIEEKLKGMDQLRQSALQSKRRHNQEQEQMNESIKKMKSQQRQDISKLKAQFQEQLTSNKASLQKSVNKLKGEVNEQSNNRSLQQRLKDIENRCQQFTNIISKIQQHQSNQEFSFNKVDSRFSQPNQFNQINQNYQGNHQRQHTNNQVNFQHNYSSNQKESNKEKSRKNSISSQSKIKEEQNLFVQENQKKVLPPKKNLFQNSIISPIKEPEPSGNARGGIRGLLDKSKEKEKSREKQEFLRKPEPFRRQMEMPRTKKGLPPVKEDPFTKKKLTQHDKQERRGKQQQQQAIIYQVDEQGYLVDEQGNYILDQNNQMIRLSPQQIEQYMNDQSDEYYSE